MILRFALESRSVAVIGRWLCGGVVLGFLVWGGGGSLAATTDASQVSAPTVGPPLKAETAVPVRPPPLPHFAPLPRIGVVAPYQPVAPLPIPVLPDLPSMPVIMQRMLPAVVASPTEERGSGEVSRSPVPASVAVKPETTLASAPALSLSPRPGVVPLEGMRSLSLPADTGTLLPEDPVWRETIEQAVELLRIDPGARLELRSYASGDAEDPTVARQKSMARGLALRDRLAGAGIRPTRITVRPMGDVASVSPRDRIEVIPIR